MLWDNGHAEPLKLIAEKRGLAIALTSSSDLSDQLRGALDLACFDVIFLSDADQCISAIASKKPDLILLDERLIVDTADLRDRFAKARITETLPVLPIISGRCEDTDLFSLNTQSGVTEIFLKIRALLRRERPVALSGKRQIGSFILDEPRFKLFLADTFADLNKSDLCLLGPFFDLQEATLDRQSLEALVFEGNGSKISNRILDFQISRMRRRVKAQLAIDPLRSVRGVGYALVTE